MATAPRGVVAVSPRAHAPLFFFTLVFVLAAAVPVGGQLRSSAVGSAGVPAAAVPGLKSPALAGILNAVVVPGVGNFYAGDPAHGVRHFLLAVGGAGMFLVGLSRWAGEGGSDTSGNDVLILGGAGVVVGNWVWSIFSGMADARATNARLLSVAPADAVHRIDVTVAPAQGDGAALGMAVGLRVRVGR